MDVDKVTGLHSFDGVPLSAVKQRVISVEYGPISWSCINCLETLNNEMNYIFFLNKKVLV